MAESEEELKSLLMKVKEECEKVGLKLNIQGWNVSREQHRNMYIIEGETGHQPRLDAWDKCSDLVHWEDLDGSGGEGGRGDRDGEHM